MNKNIPIKDMLMIENKGLKNDVLDASRYIDLANWIVEKDKHRAFFMLNVCLPYNLDLTITNRTLFRYSWTKILQYLEIEPSAYDAFILHIIYRNSIHVINCCEPNQEDVLPKFTKNLLKKYINL